MTTPQPSEEPQPSEPAKSAPPPTAALDAIGANAQEGEEAGFGRWVTEWKRRLQAVRARSRGFGRTEWHLWFAPLVVAASPLLTYPIAANLTEQIVYAGALLQILGVLIVAYGLHQTRKLFGKPGLLEKVRQLFGPPRDITLRVTGSVHAVAGEAVSVMTGLRSDASAPERLDALEARLLQMEKRFSASEEAQQKTLRELREQVKAEKRERTEGDKVLRSQIESALIGGLRLEYSGVVWLLAGIVFSTAPGLVIWAIRPLRDLIGLS